MQEQYPQIPITGSEELQQKWQIFQKQIAENASHLKGKFIFDSLNYDPKLIDVEGRAGWIKRLFQKNSKYQRSFLLYLPPVLKKDMRLLVLLHGTNQTIFDTQLVAQAGIQEGKKRYGWMELADKENFVIVIPQSRGLIYRNKKYYGWQPGTQDTNYLLAVMNKITSSLTYHRQKQLPSFSISRQNISIVGFSNGGLFTSDLYINYTQQYSHASKTADFSILIFINYMGGFEPQSYPQTLLKLNQQLKQTPIVLMSCKKDQNYGPCLRAHKLFQCHDCNVEFLEIDHHRHQFIYEAVGVVYQWIKGAEI